MHAHERTMLARLGFADPDRQVPLHELACQYLATPDAVQRLIRFLAIERVVELHKEEFSNEEQLSRTTWKVRSHQVVREWEIAKGTGQFRTTIGFADLVVNLHVDELHSEVRHRKRNIFDGRGKLAWSDWRSIADQRWQSHRSIGVEVKASPIALSDVIRQVKLYRSYSAIPIWIVATTYPITRADLECLKNEKLQHVYLGEQFQAFVANVSDSAPTANTEI